MKKKDYDYFVLITLWKCNYKQKELFHFSKGKGNFWKKLVNSKEQDEEMKNLWKPHKCFYVLSYYYHGEFGRGSIPVHIANSETFPFESIDILPITERSRYKYHTYFRTFIYSFPNTTLLYINIKEERINEVIYYDKEAQNDKELNRTHNFLPDPTLANKNVKWYKRFTPYTPKFFYVYDFEPSYTHWKLNGEHVCLPSNEGYPTISECINETNKYVKNNTVFVQTDNYPLYEITTTSKHPYQLKEYNIPSVFDLCLILLLFIIFIISYSRKN